MENEHPQHLISMKCLLIAVLLFSSCEFSQNSISKNEGTRAVNRISINPEGETLAKRFSPAHGFARTEVKENSFAFYLRNLLLHEDGKKVELFNGSLKGNQTAQAAVVKMDVGTQDLQQCADAVMRLRAEYLYQQKKYDQLHFNFTNGFNAKYSTWRNGNGIAVKGNRVSWINSSKSNGSYESFRKYLNKVFMYAGTASLEKELKQKELKDIEAGDVFIKGGHPGHAVLVVDVATNDEGDKVFMLAQSYMPAQEIHILNNPSNSTLSPWYQVSEVEDMIQTPEWTFYSNQLRTFE